MITMTYLHCNLQHSLFIFGRKTLFNSEFTELKSFQISLEPAAWFT